MSRNLRMGLLLAAGILLMGGSAFMVWRAGRTTQAASSAQAPSAQPVLRFASNPEPAPQLVLKDLNGKVTSMDDLKGKAVLVNFWATWCPPCRAEIPALIELQKNYQDRLQIVGISEDDNEDDVRAFVKKMGMNYPIVMATTALTQAYGGVSALPTTFVVDPQGRVVERHLGLLDTATTELEVRSLTGLPVDARVEHFEDTGQIFNKNIEKATELPGVDFTGLTADEKKEALRRMNSESCTCGCKMTVAQCRVNDDACPVSKALAASIIKDVREGKPEPATAPESN